MSLADLFGGLRGWGCKARGGGRELSARQFPLTSQKQSSRKKFALRSAYAISRSVYIASPPAFDQTVLLASFSSLWNTQTGPSLVEAVYCAISSSTDQPRQLAGPHVKDTGGAQIDRRPVWSGSANQSRGADRCQHCVSRLQRTTRADRCEPGSSSPDDPADLQNEACLLLLRSGSVLSYAQHVARMSDISLWPRFVHHVDRKKEECRAPARCQALSSSMSFGFYVCLQ